MSLGYRDDGLFGDGVRDAAKVIVYETLSLGNTDIIDYCVERYPVSESCKDGLYDSLENDDETGFESAVGQLLSELGSYFGKEIKYCLWLCDSPQTVKDAYASEYDDFVISSYETSDVVLDDLGEDGILYGYEKPPKPVEEEIESKKSRNLESLRALFFS